MQVKISGFFRNRSTHFHKKTDFPHPHIVVSVRKVCFCFLFRLDQLPFLCPRKLFNLPLPPHRLFFGGIRFKIHQFYRSPAFGVFGTFSHIVCLNAVLKIVGPAGVKCSIAAFHDVSEIFRMFLHLTALPAHLQPVSARP